MAPMVSYSSVLPTTGWSWDPVLCQFSSVTTTQQRGMLNLMTCSSLLCQTRKTPRGANRALTANGSVINDIIWIRRLLPGQQWWCLRSQVKALRSQGQFTKLCLRPKSSLKLYFLIDSFPVLLKGQKKTRSFTNCYFYASLVFDILIAITKTIELKDAWLDSAEVDTLNASREKIKKFPRMTFPLEISGSQRSRLLMRWSLEKCYVAPEYAMTGHLLVKSDVYRYGVVLLGLLSGRSRSICPSHPRSPPAGRLSQASHAVVQALKLMYNDSDASDGIVSGNGSMPWESQQQDVKSRNPFVGGGGTYASGGGGGGGGDERIRTVARHGWESGSFNSIDYDSRTFGEDRAGKQKALSSWGSSSNAHQLPLRRHRSSGSVLGTE
ncbi:hypothetical protein SELMODRAFT_415616 [Selaginella moellendorffii]|uniref:Protein kinase domain-containing protein n=1 Tax=Selaginella moellendorffii TaxID=88036 RepID=D8RWP8_SELML|nr:hypothetical protein SELMODRAFT_415616 [Selaginella moellendorffii]